MGGMQSIERTVDLANGRTRITETANFDFRQPINYIDQIFAVRSGVKKMCSMLRFYNFCIYIGHVVKKMFFVLLS